MRKGGSREFQGCRPAPRCPACTPVAFSQLRRVSMQIPRSLAASVLGRPCSVTIRMAPALNPSSYRGGAIPFLRLFSISFVPFPFHYNECFLSIDSGKGAGSRWPSCLRTRPCAPRPPKAGMRADAAARDENQFLVDSRGGHRESKGNSGLCGVRPACAAGSRRVADPDPLIASGRESL